MERDPVIGILCLNISKTVNEKYNGEYKSFIPASYVKFLESAGAKVIPIWIGKSKQFYEDLLKKINGVLLPGGALFFNETGGYAEAGKYIYEIASKMNESGNYFPIIGICLGYELMLYICANTIKETKTEENLDPRQDCNGENHCIPLEFKKDVGRLFSNAPLDVLEIFKNENVTYNFHRYCITEEDLETYNLSEYWKVLSTNKDWNNLEYISSIEHKRFPFYGLQFHPEKNSFEHYLGYQTLRTSNAIRCSQYLGNFFVNECRKNTMNRFCSDRDEVQHLIYNYPVTFTASKNLKFFQCYLFKENVDYLNNNEN